MGILKYPRYEKSVRLLKSRRKFARHFTLATLEGQFALRRFGKGLRVFRSAVYEFEKSRGRSRCKSRGATAGRGESAFTEGLATLAFGSLTSLRRHCKCCLQVRLRY